LQSVLGLVLGQQEQQTQTALPFALQRLSQFRELPRQGWVVVRHADDSDEHGAVQRLDIELLDDGGQVCARLNGFSVRQLAEARPEAEPLAPGASEPAPLRVPPVGDLSLVPVWSPIAGPADGAHWPQTQQCLVVIASDLRWQELEALYPEARRLQLQPGESIDSLVHWLGKFGEVDHVLWELPADENTEGAALVQAQEQGVIAAFRLFKALLALRYDSRKLGLTVLTTQAQPVHETDPAWPAHASVHGLLGSVAKEYSGWKIRLLDLPAPDRTQPSLTSLLRREANRNGDAQVFRQGQWHGLELLPLTLDLPPQPAYRRGGVYVLIGGAGGIGRVLSEHLIRHHQAQVVWIGRRGPTERANNGSSIEQLQQLLGALGPQPHYIAADASDVDALQAAREQILQRFGTIHGVVLATIVLEDRSLARMDEAVLRASLRAKVDVSVCVQSVFGAQQLAQRPDFFVLFSSIQSQVKARGQSNYAAGCVFSDAFARAWRQKGEPVQVVNWGYWGSVGVVSSPDYRQRMEQHGIGSIEPPQAMELLERLLGSPVDHLVFVKTTRPEVTRELGVSMKESMRLWPEEPVQELDLAPRHTRELAHLPQLAQQSLELEQVLAQLLCGLLETLGLYGQRDLQAWKQATGLPAHYERWLHHSLRTLQLQGQIAWSDGAWQACAGHASAQQARALWTDYLQQHAQQPHLRAQLALVDRTTAALEEILQGRRQAVEVIFPNASLELVEGIYKDNLIADHFNEVLCDSLVRYVEQRLQAQPLARIRVLEIGAGTGGTSARVFARLQEFEHAIEEYCYTDISKAFLLHAQQRYAARVPYLKTALFNVEQPLEGQQAQAGSYDVVIATNVLHATRDMRRTVRNAKALLRRGGLLLVNEINDSTWFSHLTFGLLEGWWLYEDEALRQPGSPALAPAGWQHLLRSEGFDVLPDPAVAQHAAGQQILVARSDGLVRQHRVAEACQPAARPVPARATAPASATGGELREKLQGMLIQLIGEQLKLSADDIDVDSELSEFGFDSITLTGFGNELNARYGLQLSPTSFFEHPTVKQLAQYLASEHAGPLARHFRADT
ncbi:MAG: SDR family NAD(P)-dependent oxidoreductase, partial [Giesbergeria sp.]